MLSIHHRKSQVPRKRPTLSKIHPVSSTVRLGKRKSTTPLSQTPSKRPKKQRLPWRTLPPELYRNIIELVSDPEDLYNLCLTSRICHFEADRILYRIIDLLQNTRAPVLWANTMLDCPIKAAAVQSLTLRFDLAFLIVPHMLLPSLQLISQALRALPNLRKLFLVGHPLAMMHPIYLWLLDGCTTNLEVFHNSIFPFFSTIPFLLRQPNIKEWKQIGSTTTETMTDVNLLPLSVDIDVHASILSYFTTPRPLVRLRLKMDSLCTGEGKGERKIIKRLSLFGPTLTSLIIDHTTTDQALGIAELLSILSDATPNLKLLHYNNTVSTNTFNYGDCIVQVRRLLKLEVLVLPLERPGRIPLTLVAERFLNASSSMSCIAFKGDETRIFHKHRGGGITEGESIEILDYVHEGGS